MDECALSFRPNSLSYGLCFRVLFRHGALTDGISTPKPKPFQAFLPSWKPQNQLYCLIGATHDALYASEGFDGLFSRKDSDDILRGGLRCAHENREKAGIADVCVMLFARRHWGRDENDLRDFTSVEIAEW